MLESVDIEFDFKVLFVLARFIRSIMHLSLAANTTPEN